MFEDETPLTEASVRHSRGELDACGGFDGQLALRAGVVARFLDERGVDQ